MTMFKVRQHDLRPLAWWYEQFRRDLLDMSPQYQRRSNLWNTWKRAHLIDSIANGFDVPKFYVADFTGSRSGLNRAKRPYAIVDGKQRFEAIFNFFAGNLKLNSSFRLLDNPTLPLGGMTYPEIKQRYPQVSSRIDEFIPVVMSIVTDQAGMIEQMFVRLNSGEPVNSAERRNAMPGPVPPMIRELTQHPFFTESIRFSTLRMQEYNLAAKLLLIEFNGGFVDTKARNLDQFVLGALAVDDLSSYEDAQANVFETLEALYSVFEPNDRLLSAQGQIPIYYWIVRKNPTTVRYLRTFLETFTKDVQENLELSRTDPDHADPELSSYYTSSRTTNDHASLKDRYRILLKRLKDSRRSS